MINYSNDNISKYNEEDSIFNSEIYKLVDGNIYPIFPFDKINYSLETYIINNKIRIDYLEFEKLKASQFILDDYIKLEKAENLLEKRLFCINNFKFICANDFVPSIDTISKEYLNYIYDNINIFFNILEIETNHSFLLLLRYGLLNQYSSPVILKKLHDNKHEITSEQFECFVEAINDNNLYYKEATLEECGNIYRVTRERIRQQIVVAERRLVTGVKAIIRGSYEEIFLFEFNKRFLNDVLYINDFIINNRGIFCRDLLYSDSLFTPAEFFEIYRGQWNEVEAQYFISNGYVNINNQWVLKNKIALFKFFINKTLHNPTNIEEIYYKYTRFCSKYIAIERKNKSGEKNKELKSLAALIERQDNIIKSNKHYRLRIIENNSTFLEDLDIIIDAMPGFFSTKKIFDENSSLMGTFNIIDQYELHYFIRQNINYFAGKIKMERMPHISKGYSLEEYLETVIEKIIHPSFDDFLEEFTQLTGILPQTIIGNQSSIIERYYLYNKRLKQDYLEPPKNYMEAKYNLGMYAQEEYIEDLHLYGYHKFLEQGFKVVWDYLVKGANIKSYLLSQFDEFGLTKFANITNLAKESNGFKTSLYYSRLDLEIIRFDESLFLLVSTELRREIKKLISMLHNELLKYDYITLAEFMDMVEAEKYPLIDSYQFGELFYTEILYSEKSIKLLYNIIYYEGTSPLGIIDDLVKERKKISIWDIEHYMENKRDWKFSQNFINRIKYSDKYYYVKEIDSVFYDKKAFIKYLKEN